MRKKIFFQYGRLWPTNGKNSTKKVLLLQGDEVVVYYLRTSATCHSAFRVRETKRFKTVLYVYQYRYTVSWTDVNGKLVRAMGRHGFLVYFPAKNLLVVWHAAAFTYPTVCNGSRRESSLRSKQACRPSISRCPKSAR